MLVFHSLQHLLHQPPFELLEGGEVSPYFESPARMAVIEQALNATGWARWQTVRPGGLAEVLAVHSADYVDYLRTAHTAWQAEGGQLRGRAAPPMLLGATFPPRRAPGRPQVMAGLAGYYSFDTSCPLVAGTFEAALASAHTALAAAQHVQAQGGAAFALCRPPGHHAGRDFAGGYCYLNNAAIAAHWLAQFGRVAVLDVDYHAGNGTQDIFYATDRVLTLSLHADPARQYPFFVGYADETGVGAGQGWHANWLLPRACDDETYLDILAHALARIRAAAPRALVVSFGADIYAEDPLGDVNISTAGFGRIGAAIAALNLPTVIVMEGGYATAALGENTVRFLQPFVRP